MNKINKKVLVVDDSESYLLVISEGLMTTGFEVVSAKDGQEGLELAQKENPDIILADISMPKIDGITMVEKIRGLDIKTPVIFLTNMSDIEHISKAMQVDVNLGYIVKSDMTTEDIINKVKERLGIK